MRRDHHGSAEEPGCPVNALCVASLLLYGFQFLCYSERISMVEPVTLCHVEAAAAPAAVTGDRGVSSYGAASMAPQLLEPGCWEGVQLTSLS